MKRLAVEMLGLFLAATCVWCAPPGEISGRALLPDGKPAAGAEVHLVHTVFQPSYKVSLVKSTTADGAGRFSFPGETVAALTKGQTRLAIVIRKRGQGIGWVRVRADSAPPFTVTLWKSFQVSGKVIDSKGKPVPGARVSVSHLREQTAGAQSSANYVNLPPALTKKWQVATNAQGRFTGLEAAGSIDSLDVAAPNRGWETVGVGLVTRETTPPVELRLGGVGTISGRVVCPDKSVSLAGIHVRYMAESGSKRFAMDEATTDAAGRFTFKSAPAGKIRLDVPLGSPPPWVVVKPISFRLADGEKKTGVTVELKRGVKVSGRVVDADTGAPIAGAWIWGRTGPGLSQTLDARSDAHGRFTTYALPGKVSLGVGSVPQPYSAPELGTGMTSVTVGAKPVTVPDFKVSKGAFIEGVVVDAQGRPAPKAQVKVIGALFFWDRFACRADAHGRFKLGPVSRKKPLTLAAHTSTAFSAPVVVSFTEPMKPVRLVVREGIGVTLRGRVLDRQGRPAEGAKIDVRGRYQSMESSVSSTTTDAKGRFELKNLAPRGKYGVCVRPERFSGVTSAYWPAAPGAVHDFGDLKVVRLSAKVAGVVVGADGRPVAGATVWNSGDAPKKTETLTDARGRFTLRGFAPGFVYVFARKKGYRFRGTCAATGAKTKLVLYRQTESSPPVKLRPAPPPDPAKLRKAAQKLIDLGFKEASANKQDSSDSYTLDTLCGLQARIDPFMASAFSAGVGHRYDRRVALTLGILALRQGRLEEACAYFNAAGPSPEWGPLYLEGVKAVRDSRPELARQLLRRATPFLRTAVPIQYRVYWLAAAGKDMSDLGMPEGRQLIRAAAAQAGRLSVGRQDAFIRRAVALALCEYDLEGAVALVTPLHDGWEKQNALMSIAARVAPRLPQRAVALFRSAFRPEFLDTGRIRLCEQLAPEHLTLALKLADEKGQTVDSVRWRLYLAIARRVWETDKGKALKLLDRAAQMLLEKGAEQPPVFGSASSSVELAEVAAQAAAWGHPKAAEWMWRALSLRGGADETPSSRRAADARLAVVLATLDADTARDFVKTVLPRIQAIRFTNDDYESARVRTNLALAAFLVDPDWGVNMATRLREAGANVDVTRLVKWALGTPSEREKIIRSVMPFSIVLGEEL